MEDKNVMAAMEQELRRGTIVLCVLSQLRQPMYGYNLVQALGEKGIAAEANTLYPLLRRLESQGLLKSEWETGGSKPRKYYGVTELGNEVYEELRAVWIRMTGSMNQILEVAEHEK